MDVVSLPNELVETIVSLLDNLQDYRSCALVSWTLYRAAIRHIYRSLPITIYEKEPRYAELRCRRLNSLIRAKPYVLNYVQRLHVVLSSKSTPAPGSITIREKWINALVKESGNGEGEDQTDSFVALLLRLTHAPRLEELTIEYEPARDTHAEFMEVVDFAKIWLKEIIGSAAPLALYVIRCMPSIRRVHLQNLYYPPLPLIIGIPGSDAVEYLMLHGVNYSMRPSIQSQAWEYWAGVDIERDGPLAALFRAARFDWDVILRVWRRHLTSSGLTDVAHPFRCLTQLCLSRGSQLAQHLEHVAGPRGPGELFPVLRIFHDRRTTTLLGPMAEIFSKDVQSRWLIHLSVVERLIIDVNPMIDSYEDWIRPSTFHRLRQLEFVHRGDEFKVTYMGPMTWLSEVASYLQQLECHHQIEEVVIRWSVHHPWISNTRDAVYKAAEWNRLEELMDRVPALCAARMVLSWDLDFGPRAIPIDCEEYAKGQTNDSASLFCSVNMNMLPMPNEVFELVLDEIKDDCQDHLWTLALASKAFYRLAARRLYRHIRIQVIIHPWGAPYSESYCQTLLALFLESPYVLTFVRSVEVLFTPEDTWRWVDRCHERGIGKPTDVATPQKHYELTKLLLRLTHAEGLKTFAFLDKGYNMKRALPYSAHVFFALLAVRCMPSLRQVRFENPESSFATAIPGKDQVEEMTVGFSDSMGGNLFSKVWRARRGLPKDEPLVTHFTEAKSVDWDTIVRLYQMKGSSNVVDPQCVWPFGHLTNLRLSVTNRLFEFQNDLKAGIRRLCGPGNDRPLFPYVRTLEWDDPDGDGYQYLETLGELLRLCPAVQKLSIHIHSNYTPHEFNEESLIPSGAVPFLSEIEFSLKKPSPPPFPYSLYYSSDTMGWAGVVYSYLRAVRPYHALKKVTIQWPEMVSPGGKMETLLSDRRWRTLEELLSLDPLAMATMTLNAVIPGAVEDSEYAKRVRDIWKHPKCFISCP